MKHGAIFLLLGGACLTGAILQQGVSWILAWPGTSLILVGVAYILNRPRWLGKRDNGRRRPVVKFLLLPYFILVHWTWALARRLRTGPAYEELLPGFVIGRRLLAREVPSDIATLVDLTAEFPEGYPVRSGRTYLACPILDGQVPEDAALFWLLDRLESAPKPAYIHCAEGHGRTGLVACALLLSLGEAGDVDEALRRVRERRPRVRLSASQARMLERISPALTVPARRAPAS